MIKLNFTTYEEYKEELVRLDNLKTVVVITTYCNRIVNMYRIEYRETKN